MKGGLRDLSVSRASFQPSVPDDDAHVMYVWLDALTNYITATGWPKDGAFGDAERNRRYWPLIFLWLARISCAFMPSTGLHS